MTGTVTVIRLDYAVHKDREKCSQHEDEYWCHKVPPGLLFLDSRQILDHFTFFNKSDRFKK